MRHRRLKKGAEEKGGGRRRRKGFLFRKSTQAQESTKEEEREAGTIPEVIFCFIGRAVSIHSCKRVFPLLSSAKCST